MMAESSGEIEFRTIYETRTQTLKPGEEPPKGAKRVGVEEEVGELPVYPEGQNPDTGDGEKRPYRT
jgi:hypothetical protein